MAKALEAAITNQIAAKRISGEFVFSINGTPFTDYLISYQISFDRGFGSATASFVLANDQGIFGEAGANTINVGDVVALVESYEGSTTDWKSFYGRVDQRSVDNTSDNRTITLSCLDYISLLKYWDIDLEVEGTKIEMTNETLSPVFLDSPNEMYAQVFNFANTAIAQVPAPVFTFRDKNNQEEDPQYTGNEVYYDDGQVKLSSPINALYNYDYVAVSYYFYTQALYAEDILEAILTAPNGYDGYLFDEATPEDVVTNHLTTTFNTEEGTSTDYMTTDSSVSIIDVRHLVALAISAGDTSITLDSVEGVPISGTATINGDTFTWVSKSGNTLLGIPATGPYALNAHPANSSFVYEMSCDAGRVWYLKYSNIQTTLTASDFTIGGGGVFNYFDARYGRIILTAAISLASTVSCNTNYTFKTLQATGIELNWMQFLPREVENRYAAIEKLRGYLAPNYVIRTQGDEKIFAGYLRQSASADYTLTLVKSINYSEDSDLYTRVVLYGNNKNPRNIALDDGISFSTTGASYKATATQIELLYDKTENGWHSFKTGLPDAGKIVTTQYLPIVYIGGVQVDNKLHQLAFQPLYIEKTQTTETSSGGK